VIRLTSLIRGERNMPAAVCITRQEHRAEELRSEAKHTDDADVARRMESGCRHLIRLAKVQCWLPRERNSFCDCEVRSFCPLQRKLTFAMHNALGKPLYKTGDQWMIQAILAGSSLNVCEVIG
jgi:hypothetical protein